MGKAGRKSDFVSLTDAQKAEFVELCQAGVTVKELGKHFKKSISAIKRWRERLCLQKSSDRVAPRNQTEQELFKMFLAAGANTDFAAAKHSVGAIHLTAKYLIEAVPYTIDTTSPDDRIAAALELLSELSAEPIPEHQALELRSELARLVADPERMNADPTYDLNDEGDSLMRSAERLRRQMVRQAKGK